jgi:hypothetical protein
MEISSTVRTAVAASAIVLAVGHLWYLYPLPNVEAHQVVSGLIAKGAALTNQGQQELEEGLRAAFLWNRICDLTLAIAAVTTAFALRRNRKTVVIVGALLYSIVALAYAAVALDVGKWGIGQIAMAEVSQLRYLIAHDRILSLGGHVFRLVSFAWGLIALAVVASFALTRAFGKPRRTSS